MSDWEEPVVRPLGRSPLDRGLQKAMLLWMQAAYPDGVTSFGEDSGHITEAEKANLAYLVDYGLAEASFGESSSGLYVKSRPKITARGLDFLADDGGLGAILNVVTVKLHADTIRDLLMSKVDATDLPSEKKSALKEHLRKLPGTVLQAAATDLVKKGLEHLPDAIHWLQGLRGPL